MGLDAFYQHISDISHGRKTIKEIIIEMAKAPVNTVAQGSFPFVKLAGEIITRRATFPDVFEPRTVRDPWYHIAQSFGLDKEFKWLTGAPVEGGRTIENPVLGMPEGFIRNWSNLFVYHYNPGASAYGEILSQKQRFKRKIGKGGEGFWLSPVHNVLYNYRLALKAHDKAATARFLIEYQKITGIGGNELKTVMRRQIKNLFPLAGLNWQEAMVFKAQLSGEDRQRLNNAILYWISVISGIQYNDLRLQVLEKYGIDMSSYRKGGK